MVLRGAVIVLFLWAVGRFWHPYYGFTRFLQADPGSEQVMLPVLRGAPIFIHPGPGSYDGFFYAQIATAPGLGDPALSGAMDDFGYRARRILLSGVAWVVAGGDAVGAVRAYAWLNIVAWLALAVALWRLLPVGDGRATLAWVGILGGAGALLSVRLALTDLPALLFLCVGLAALERGRRVGAGICLGAAALCRETAWLGLVSLLPRERWTGDNLKRTLPAVALAVLPLTLWLAFVLWKVGRSGAGLGNLVIPGLGWWEKLRAILEAPMHGPDRALVVASLLGHVGLAMQAVFLLLHRDWRCPWWRLGAAGTLLLLCLGPAVWGEDLPGASVRVLLPLGLAFNLVAVRRRAAWAWLLAGNLAVSGGVVALWHVPTDPRELAAGKFATGRYVVRGGAGWHNAESWRVASWMWCDGDGVCRIDLWPRQGGEHDATVELTAITPRTVEAWQGERLLWSGLVGAERVRAELRGVSFVHGGADIRFRSAESPVQEPGEHGRAISFAAYRVLLR